MQNQFLNTTASSADSYVNASVSSSAKTSSTLYVKMAELKVNNKYRVDLANIETEKMI